MIRERYDGAFLGALRPLFLGVEHRGQYEPPQRTEKADVGSRTRQVVLTEPLRFRLGHPMDHSNAAGSPRRFASLRCEPLTLACPLMGYVCRFVVMRISAFRGCETPSRPTKKRLRAASNFVGEHCRSHSLAELRWKGHWCSCTCFCSDAPSGASSCV